jgi:hypothetical protein
MKGYKFELYCTDLYRSMGKIDVRHNIQYNFRSVFNRKLMKKLQVDIEYKNLLLQTRTVECKYHKNANVGPAEVEGFIETLKLLDRSYGIMMTNTDYSSTAAKLAQKYNISLLGHDDLVKMSKHGLVGKLLSSSKTLEQRIDEIRLEEDYLRPKIKTVRVLF